MKALKVVYISRVNYEAFVFQYFTKYNLEFLQKFVFGHLLELMG